MRQTAADIQRAIGEFFELFQRRAVFIVLPTGWPGRPYDNAYGLESSSIDAEDIIELRLTWGSLSLDADSYFYSFSVDDREIALRIRVTSGQMRTGARILGFGSGEVVFIVKPDPDRAPDQAFTTDLWADEFRLQLNRVLDSALRRR